MRYVNSCVSPLGLIFLAADETGLTGLWFEDRKNSALYLEKERGDKLPIFEQTKSWLDIYFSGKEPDFRPPLNFSGTPFQNDVWEILLTIPYGETTTYGEIAKLLANKRNIPRMSAQAIGGAVGRNKISIIVPCHRVIGANGDLIGYAGGLGKKRALLNLEKNKKGAF